MRFKVSSLSTVNAMLTVTGDLRDARGGCGVVRGAEEEEEVVDEKEVEKVEGLDEGGGYKAMDIIEEAKEKVGKKVDKLTDESTPVIKKKKKRKSEVLDEDRDPEEEVVNSNAKKPKKMAKIT